MSESEGATKAPSRLRRSSKEALISIASLMTMRRLRLGLEPGPEVLRVPSVQQRLESRERRTDQQPAGPMLLLQASLATAVDPK